MKLHTRLTAPKVAAALRTVKAKGLMADDIMFYQFGFENSKSHPHGFLIQLGTYDETSGKSRHYKNSGQVGATSGLMTDDRVWAASFDEWGWFISEIFRLDPKARFGHYLSRDDFNTKTRGKFK